MNHVDVDRQSASDAYYVAIGEYLVQRASIDGRVLSCFVDEWLRHCEAVGRDPVAEPEIVTILADCDRYAGNKLGEREKELELRAWVCQQDRTRAKEEQWPVIG